MKNILNKILISSVLGAALTSCSFFEVEPHVICSDTFYKTQQEVEYGLAGVYGSMSHEQFYGSTYSLMCSNIDDLSYYNRAASTAYLAWFNHGPGTGEIYDVWTRIYDGIGNANSFMEAIEDSDFENIETYYAEARFLRAYYHFLLAQAWGDVPLRKEAVKNPSDVMLASSPQEEVLAWCVDEMEQCLVSISDDVANAPSRVTKNTVFGILARVNLFMAGETVRNVDKQACLRAARDYADSVMVSNKHRLNPDYSQAFKNMISNDYDREYYESMWEVEFYGDRSTADNWSNGRIGDLLGLQSGDSNSSDFGSFKCNFAHGMYNGSLKLWDLYLRTDRTADENDLAVVTDKRQDWNLPPYSYKGHASQPPYGSGLTTGSSRTGIDKTPYVYNKVSTSQDPLAAPAIRMCGKFRREVELEGQKTAKLLYNQINYPLLRYSDVLLMYAEASNELDGLNQKAYDCLEQVRARAGIKTNPIGDYDTDTFRELLRNERGREFCFESLRKYDLIRWGIFVEEMNNYSVWTADERWSKETTTAAIASTIGGNVTPKHIVFPVPSIELGVNDLLKQNPLW